MKKWLVIVAAVLSLAFTAPAMAQLVDGNNNQTQGAIGDGNVGIQVDGHNKGTINVDSPTGGDAIGGDASITQRNVGNVTGGDASITQRNVGNVTGGTATTNSGNITVSPSQSQSQSQSSNADADADADASATSSSEINISDNSVNTVEDKRDLPSVAGGAYATNAPAHFEHSTLPGNIAEAENVLQFRQTFTISMLKAIESGEKLNIKVKAYQSLREKLGYPEKGYKGLPLDGKITILLKAPDNPDQYKDVCYVTARGDKETLSFAAIASAAVEAFRHGSDTLVVTGEGVKKLIEAGGWGIMLGGSGTFITGDGGNSATGAVIAPGVGYAEAWSGYEYSPWIQAFGLKTK